MDDLSFPSSAAPLAASDQIDEDFLTYSVSDEALEATAGTEKVVCCLFSRLLNSQTGS
jgi:hypothetical protein